MHPTQDLIGKLSGREKAHFRRLNVNSNSAQFMKLYDFLNLNPYASIDLIRNNFKGTPIGNRPHVELNYLYHHLLRALLVFHLKTNSLAKLLSFAQILIEKKELNQASKIVQKLKSKAYNSEELEFILNAINLEGKIKDIGMTVRSKEDLNNEYTERSKIITEIQNRTLLKKLKLELLNIQYHYIFNRIEMIDEVNLVKKSLDSIIAVPFTFLGKDLWFSVNSLFYQAVNDYDQSQAYTLKSLNLTKQNKEKTDELDQLKALNNYLFVTILRKDYVEFNDKYAQLLSLEKSDNVPTHKYQYFKIYLKLAMEVNMNHPEELTTLISTSLEQTLSIIDLLPPLGRDELFQLLTSACLLTNNYKRAQKILLLWSQHPIKGGVFLTIKINKIITFFGQGDKRLLKYEIDNFSKLLESSDKKNELYKILIQLFRRSISQEKIQEKHIAFAQDAIIKLRKSKHPIFDYYELDYVCWLEAYKGLIKN